MRFIYMFVLSVMLFGCSGEQITNSITKTQIAMSGNKPPASYRVANLQTMRDYVFHTKHFSFSLPGAKQSDFSTMGGWWGASHRDGNDITAHLHPVYHISVSTSGNTLKYGERDRAIETRDKTYIRYVRKHYKYPQSTKLYYGVYGKENYACIVKERVDEFNRYKIAYSCYKFNPKRTKSKHVTVILTYNKPKDPKLAKEYTYEDLKRRAGRMLDSLYIKEGW